MVKTAESRITGKFNWRIPNIIPSFIEGADSKAIYDKIKETISEGIWYDESQKLMKGSNPFIAAKVDSLLRPLGIRVANAYYLNRPEIMDMIKDRFYSDAPVLVLRSMKDSYSRNMPLIKTIAEEVEKKTGRLNLPLMITGFDVSPLKEDREGYGFTVVPREDFSVISDERLSGKYNGKKFNNVDKQGLPNFDSNGNRTWYARSEGLSRLFPGGSLGLVSSYEYLAYSFEDGRVVLVRGEATQKIFDLGRINS